jgi:hypothetical protein
VGRQVLLTVGVLVAVSAVVFVVNHFFVHRPLWDWLKLLVVPAVIAGGGIWFNRQQRERELEIAAQQREQELELAERRTQDEALQAYLDQMSGMLIPNKDQPSLYKARPGDSLSSVARARTLTVLPRLDGERKAQVVQFLYESGLIAKGRPVLELQGADLSGANLREANLRDANLSWADLSWVDLSWAYLGGADLRDADLREANLMGADLSGADLMGANLLEAYLGAVDLRDADLREANLIGTMRWTGNQLSAAKYLDGATMPDGRILQGDVVPGGPTFEDWLREHE